VDYLNKHKEGIILAVLLHIILLFILLHFGFFTPLPLPEEQGVLIDFGTSDAGKGITEPAPAEVEAKEEIPTVPAVKKPVPVKKSAAPQEKIVTQDFEKTAAIEAQRKQDEIKRQKQKIEDNRKRDSLQHINEERIAEQRRLAEIQRQDSLREAAKQASINQINSRAKNAFGVSGKGTDPNSSGQGTSYKPGNQGSPDGVAGGGKGDGTGTGDGSGTGNGRGTGISFSLSGRSALSLPKPSYPGNNEGIVVVEVNVDKYGTVTKANVGVKGSTSLDAGLLEAARKAALSTKFNQNLDAPAFQTGTITYHFVLD
jgi:colicin import membrane protein